MISNMPKPLSDIMRSEFAQAKRWFRAVAVIQWGLAAVAVYAISTNVGNVTLVVLAAFIGPILSFVCREVGGYYNAKGDRVRRLNLLQQGLGREPAESELLDILGNRAGAVTSEPLPIGTYFAASSSSGFARLLFRLQESAFWTSALARRTAIVHYAVAASGTAITLLVAFFALRAPTPAPGQVAVDFSRLFSTLLVFFLSGSAMASARGFHSLTDTAGKVMKHAAELRRGDVDPIELYKVLAMYDAALSKTPPIPSYIYRWMQKQLQDAWDAAVPQEDQESNQ